jgi:hypothetical protein
VSAARVKADRERVAYFQQLSDEASGEALRAAEALVAALRKGAGPRRVAVAAYDAHMAAADLCGWAINLDKRRRALADTRAGRRRRPAPAWHDPAAGRSARQRRTKRTA